MDEGHVHLTALLALFFGAFLMPILSKRLRIPSAILLIGYGFCCGPNGLSFIPDDAIIGFLNELAFILLMFLAGLEIDFNSIRSKDSRTVRTLFAICLAVFAVAFLSISLLGLPPIYGLILAATSVGLPLAVLKETGHLKTEQGQTIILLGSIGEFLTVIGMTLIYFFNRYGASMELLWGLGRLAVLLAVAGLTLKQLMALAWWKPYLFSRFVDPQDTSEIGVRAALLLMMSFAMLAIFADVEAVLGAFIAGALLAYLLRGKEILEEKLAAVGHGFFIPIFFAVVGLRLDPQAFTLPNFITAGLLFTFLFLAKLLPSLALLREGQSVREMFATASLLSAPLTLIVAIAALGVELELLDPSEESAVLILAIMSGVLFPFLFRLLAGPPPAETSKAR